MASNQKVISFNSDNTMTINQVNYVDAEHVETKNDIFKLSDATKYYETKTGQLFYIFSCDLPAKVEAEQLKKLRRSMALKQMFNYEKDSNLNVAALVPWIVAIVAIIF